VRRQAAAIHRLHLEPDGLGGATAQHSLVRAGAEPFDRRPVGMHAQHLLRHLARVIGIHNQPCLAILDQLGHAPVPTHQDDRAVSHRLEQLVRGVGPACGEEAEGEGRQGLMQQVLGR
jgi:hypothetical protein